MILYNFTNCLVFIDTKQTSHYNVVETFIFHALMPCICFSFLRWVKFCRGCFRQVFFIWETKKVVAGRVKQVVVLHSNDCMGICLGGLSNGRLRRVMAL